MDEKVNAGGPDRAVLDLDNVRNAIKGVQALFTRRGLTVAEAIHTVRSLDAAYRAEFPEAYALMASDAPRKASK